MIQPSQCTEFLVQKVIILELGLINALDKIMMSIDCSRSNTNEEKKVKNQVLRLTSCFFPENQVSGLISCFFICSGLLLVK